LFSTENEEGKLIEWEDLGSETDQIGQHISTKAVGSYKREDITLKYKYAEGKLKLFILGVVHKRRPQSGGFSVRTFFGQGVGSSDAVVLTFWSKNLQFSTFMMCPHGQGGVEPVRTFFGQ